MKSILVLSALAYSVPEDTFQSWENVVESLHNEDECSAHDSSCSVTLLQMRSNMIKKDVAGDEVALDSWEDLDGDCEGSSQSPIDLPAAGEWANRGDPLEVSYFPADASQLAIKNTGRGLKVAAEFGELILPDGAYVARQLGIHCPSEHTMEGRTFPCEMHIVHQRRSAEGTDGMAVIAIMLQQAKSLGLNADTGRELAFFRRLGLGNRLGLPKEGQKKPIENIPLDLTTSFRRSLQGGYWHYQGSGTTPPCAETVHWYVMKQPAAISEEMFENFLILFPNPGNRGVQPLNGRQIVIDEEAVDGEFPGAAVPHWTYGEQERWAQNFPACAGTAQSPIDLTGVPASRTGAYLNQHLHYHESRGSGLKMKNNGYSLQINANNDIGFASLYDGKYFVTQLHFHFPSEHSVDGRLAAGEMQIVHQKEGSQGMNDLAIISILIDNWRDVQDGVNDAGFDGGLEIALFRDLGFGSPLPHIGQTRPVAVDDIDIANNLATQLSGPFWHYRGSLTAPPCTEGVHWYVMHKRAVMSNKMITDFKELYPNPANNRNIQERGSRRVEMDMALQGEFGLGQ